MAGRARLAHVTHHYASHHLRSLTLRQTVLHRRRLLLRQLLCRRRQNAAAAVAHHRHVPVRRVQQTLVQQERRAVRDDRVTLHLAQTDAAVLFAALQRLARQLVDGARGAHLRLVGDLPVKNGGCPHHVSETLVVHDADVDVRLQLVAPDAAVEGLAPVVVEARRLQLLAKIVHGALLLAELERRGVLLITP